MVRFSVLGYRLTLGYLPLAFMIFYQKFSFRNLLKKSQFSKNILSIFLIFFLFVNFFYNIKFSENIIPTITKSEEVNNYVKDKIESTKSKNVVAQGLFFKESHFMPLLHKYSNDINFLSNWNFAKKNLCEDLKNYHEHKIDFDIIFTRTEYNENKCEFINGNFDLEEKNEYGLVYLKKPAKSR